MVISPNTHLPLASLQGKLLSTRLTKNYKKTPKQSANPKHTFPSSGNGIKNFHLLKQHSKEY